METQVTIAAAYRQLDAAVRQGKPVDLLLLAALVAVFVSGTRIGAYWERSRRSVDNHINRYVREDRN